MNIKEIRQILNLMKEYEIAEMDIEREGVKLSVKKNASLSAVPYPPSMPLSAQAAFFQPLPVQESEKAKSQGADSVNKEENVHLITAPIVGTFYAAPSPEASPYVSVGTKISPNDTVCIIEAMKVMNEIKAEVSGVIESINVKNGQIVEFGQVLFKVKI
ncbi:MAG: acetyl-CoA carboxylase biotin carboxyl carrier protein [Candidatus Aureabacteria bacterium]|nr:acetyl-CoA carboxylase biotin carboxyl carrier protein [Candidatus Auribacterota bacterium]